MVVAGRHAVPIGLSLVSLWSLLLDGAPCGAWCGCPLRACDVRLVLGPFVGRVLIGTCEAPRPAVCLVLFVCPVAGSLSGVRLCNPQGCPVKPDSGMFPLSCA